MAKKISDETLNLNVVINGDKAQAELIKLEEIQRKLTQSNKDLRAEKARLLSENKKGGEEWKRVTAELKKNNTEIKENKARMAALQKEIGITGLTVNQLKRKAAELRLSLANMIPGTARYKALEAELQQIDSRITKLRVNARGAGSALSRMANSVNKYFNLGTTVLATVAGIVFSLSSLVQGSAELSDAMADVQKTTGMSLEQVQDLSREFDQFDTRTPRIELLKLAEEAGRIGKTSKKDILDFTETANMLKVALGDDLGGEEAIRNVGKLTDQYQVGTQYATDFGEAMERLGSGINEVAQSGNNQASYLVDYLNRLSGISKQVRINAQDQLGYAATFDESGQQVETSATATSKALVDMFDNTETYARIAGMSLQDFSKLMRTDANEAFIKFLEGLNGNNDGMEIMVKRLNELDVDGSRAVSALSSLASNTELLRTRQAQANQAMQAGTSLLDEYTTKNNNLAANVDKVRRALYGKFINSSFMSFLERSFKSLADLTKNTETFEQKTRKLQATLNGELETLKNGNFTQEQRSRLIGEINTKYADYLPRLIDEKDSLADINALQKEINKNFEAKILYAAFEEEIAEAIKEQARAAEALYQNEKDRQKLKQQMSTGEADLTPGQADILQGQKDLFDAYNKDIIEGGTEAQKEIEEKYSSIFESLGLKFEEFRKKLAGLSDGNDNDDNETVEKTLTEKEIEERRKAEQEIQKFLRGLNQEEVDRIKQMFEEKIELAKKYGIDRKELEAALAEELKVLQYEKLQEDADRELEQKKAILENSLQQLWEYEEGLELERFNRQLDQVGTNEEMLAELKVEHQDRLEILQQAHLTRMLDAYRAMGLDTLDIERRLTAAKLDETQKRIEAEDRVRKSQIESAATAAFSAASQKQSAEDTKRAILNAIASQIKAYIAEAIAKFVADQIKSQGWLGLITGAAAGAAAGALFSSIIPSFDKGLYDVIDQHGDRYKAQQNEDLPTGYYTRPTFSRKKNMLVAEQRPEIVIDGLTTRRIIQFHPEVLDTINAARVRSYAGGNYPAAASGNSNSSGAGMIAPGMDLSETNALLRMVLAKLGQPAIAIADDRFARDMDEKLQRDKFINSKADL